jgi:hypothetical protein
MRPAAFKPEDFGARSAYLRYVEHPEAQVSAGFVVNWATQS